MLKHSSYLAQALALAKIRQGFCAPNPAVGAVIVKEGQVLAEGYHRQAGEAHAEIEAMTKVNSEVLEGASLYVTLEPCGHREKRTPPCTEAIVRAKIREVYYGFSDPNPKVAGQSEKFLQQQGIRCQHIPSTEIDAFYQPYEFWWQTGRPFVTAKLAISLDSRIAAKGGKPVQITGVALAHYTHQSRKASNAILTTARTIINDNPQFNARVEQETYAKPLYILDKNLTTPTHAKIFETARSITLLHQANLAPAQLKPWQERNVRLLPIALNAKQYLSLQQIIDTIGRDGVHALWVEAGGQCYQSLIQENLVQKALLYIGNKTLGREAQVAFNTEGNLFQQAKKVQWNFFADEVMCEFIF